MEPFTAVRECKSVAAADPFAHDRLPTIGIISSVVDPGHGWSDNGFRRTDVVCPKKPILAPDLKFSARFGANCP